MKVDKIQIKRGLKANLPNLDDAELGYCTDTKELYIGRGTTLTPVRIGEFDDTALRNLINTLSNTVDTIKNTVSTQGTDINNLKTGKVNIVTCTSLPATTNANTWYLKIINSGTNIDVEIYGADKKLYRPKTDASLVTYGGTTVQSMLGNLDSESSPQVNATGSNGAYTGSTGRITSLTKGKSILLFVNTDTSGYSCTLNLNSYGIKNIRDCFGNIITNLSANIPYNLCYNGTDFILLGKGGGGNVIASQVLAGMKFTNDNGTFVGTMPSVNNPTTNLNCDGSYTIPKGYHPGTEKVNANSLASQTIGNAGADSLLSGHTAWVFGSKLTGTIPSMPFQTNALSVGSSGTNKYFRIPKGAYVNVNSDGVSEIVASATQIDSNIVASNIIKGKSICGVAGTAESSLLSSGSFTIGNYEQKIQLYSNKIYLILSECTDLGEKYITIINMFSTNYSMAGLYYRNTSNFTKPIFDATGESDAIFTSCHGKLKFVKNSDNSIYLFRADTNIYDGKILTYKLYDITNYMI